MKNAGKSKILCLMLVFGVVISSTILNATSLTRTLKAVYKNMNVSYNGQTKFLSNQPFTVNGMIYVPLRSIEEIMGSSVSLANNTIYITDQRITAVSYEQEIAAKNYEIASLKQQLGIANKESVAYNGTNSTTKGSNLTSNKARDTLKQIEDDYSDEDNIDWEFSLRIIFDEMELKVSYESNKDNALKEMTQSERKAFMKRICRDISDNHQGVDITGTLEDSYKDDEIAEFEYSKSGSFTYDEDDNNYSLSEFKDKLEHDYDEIGCLNFDIPIRSIELDEATADDDELIFTINVNLGADVIRWNALNSDDEEELDDFLDGIREKIEDEFSAYDEVNGVIRDSAHGKIASYEDGKLVRNQAN